MKQNISDIKRYLLHFTIVLSLALLSSFAFSQFGSGQVQRYYFVGNIGGDPIQMDITLQEGTMNGEYYYEEAGLKLSLSGGLLNDDNVNSMWKIVEFDTEGNRIGSFDAELVNPRFHYDGPDSELDNIVLRGTWNSGDASTMLPFELVLAAEYIFLGMNNGDNIELDMSYPFFFQEQWLSLNSVTSENIMANIDFFKQGQQERLEYDNLTGWASSDTFKIHYLSDSFVSFEHADWIYLGGAHGLGSSLSRNFARVEGDWVELEVSDYFHSDSDFVGALEPNIMLGLEEKEAAWVMDGEVTGIELEDLYSVLVSPAGFDITFDPYHMGPYAQGPISVNIPFEYVGPVLNEEGPLKDVLKLSEYDSSDY